MSLFIIKNGIKILRKHLFQTVIMTLLAFFCLYILGAAIGAKETSHKAEKKYTETYGEMTLYYTSEGLSELTYQNFCNGAGREDFDKLHSFLEKLKNTDRFDFVSMSSQNLEVTSQPFDEQFLYGYEEGKSVEPQMGPDDKMMYETKSIQVSQKFFDTFSVSVSEGSGFDKGDYILNDDGEIPVLLGSAYKGSFSIGDTFEGYYMCEPFRYRVKGFVGNDAFFFNRANNKMISCERYIILPALYSDKADNFARIMLLDQVFGFVNSSLGYEVTKQIFDDFRTESGIGNWNIFLNYKGAMTSESVLDKYSAMTSEVSKQFGLIVVIMLCFASIVNIISLCSMLRENFQTFGVEMLCGASLKSIISESSTAVIMIMLLSDISASLLLLAMNYSVKAILLVQLAVTGIILFSYIICGIYIKHMNLNTYIGGKE
ncbi:MAG: hypothetical protein J5582_09455 [Ruminococcus sp.]|uniref:hypothetical protein n=1 Tax=Ruminococcus sp. TaxID=41978 RepID=UPI0025F4F9F6|nr:hypothetical protein [Ruminococcus sp.]MBO4866772.1 hypothetical protein [Ruminococcus sp.]